MSHSPDELGPPRRNIELKARCHSLAQAIAVASGLGGTRLANQLQRDTYFPCPTGRLKLREIDGQGAQLIWYSRPDQAEPKASDYLVVPVENGSAMRGLLTRGFGVSKVVEKRRIIFLHRGVRIHLDEVTGLGSFIEFEAVLGDGLGEHEAHDLLGTLREQFRIAASDLLDSSYGDMLPSPSHYRNSKR